MKLCAIKPNNVRANLLAGTVMAAGLTMSGQAQAQSANDGTGLDEIVVTAQKREQNLQDVPIAVTALSGETLQANRVTNVSDLSGLAPGVQVRAAAGGSQLASFTIRGAVSYGVVPGSDKQVSIYLDGVYLSSPRGSIFELPDVERIEVLRGPQGTLFGRNATAGAVSITTRNPTGEFAIRQDTTIGNYDQFRTRTSVDLPAFGPFSAYGSYVHSYRRGDIRNADAGIVWDRTASGLGKKTSQRHLGTKRADSFFGAIKFEPSDSFSAVYKFDRGVDHGTPEGTGLVAYDPNFPLVGPLLTALFTSQSQPVNFAPDGKRPDVVNNGFVTRLDQRSFGHNLTATYQVSDNISLRNILSYRESKIDSNSALAGFDGITFTQAAVVPYATLAAFSADPGLANAAPAVQAATIAAYAGALGPLVGSPFAGIGISVSSRTKAWNDELQLNYRSDLTTLTLGAVWFHSKDSNGGPPGAQNTNQFRVFPGAVVPLGGQGLALNEATSLAAYGQAEVHVTPTIDIIGGIRITKDKKTGTFTYNGVTGVPPTTTVIETPYRKTKANYLIGLNYKPNDNTLIYAKYSTSFVSGGPGANPILVYGPETARSIEAGFKADFLDRRLRTNLAVYTVKYRHVQSAQGSTLLGPSVGAVGPYLGTFILDQGDLKNSGAELEVTAAPVEGLTVGGSLNYSHSKFGNVNPILLALYGGVFEPTLRPKWAAGLWGQYESKPVVGTGYLSVRVDANWRSRSDANPNEGPSNPTNRPFYEPVYSLPPAWLVNSRISLRELEIAGTKAEVAVWAKNLFNDRSSTFPGLYGFVAASNYQPARTFGIDLNILFQ